MMVSYSLLLGVLIRLSVIAYAALVAVAPCYAADLNLDYLNTSIGKAEVYYGETTIFLVGPDSGYATDPESWHSGQIWVTFHDTKAWCNHEIKYDATTIPLHFTSSNRAVISIDGQGGFKVNRAGSAIISVRADMEALKIPISVVSVPVKPNMTAVAVAKAIGRPSSRVRDVASTVRHTMNGVVRYSPSEVWTYDAYPGLELRVDPVGVLFGSSMGGWVDVVKLFGFPQQIMMIDTSLRRTFHALKIGWGMRAAVNLIGRRADMVDDKDHPKCFQWSEGGAALRVLIRHGRVVGASYLGPEDDNANSSVAEVKGINDPLLTGNG